MFYFRSDGPEIFGNERKSPKSTAQGVEQIVFGTFHPASMNRCLFPGRNLPIGFEAAEVIEPHNVTGLQRPLHPLNPPVVASLAKYIPPVQRISPALTGFAEEIGRNTGNIDGLAVLIELKDVRVTPNVSAVEADEDRHVADQLNAQRHTVLMQRAPLLEKEKLNGSRDH